MKVYFKFTNGNNLVIITDEKTAKIYDAAPSGIYEGIDLYDENVVEQLKEKFAEMESQGELNSYNDIWSETEIPFDDLIAELEGAELIFEK